MKKNLAVTRKSSAKEVLRFAHPFYTDTPIDERAAVNGIGHRMTDYIKTQLDPIPDPIREPTMKLAEIIGDDGITDIQKAGVLKFHAVGDTGIETENTQQMVADAMSADYNIADPAASPAFFFHLGDVNYYDNTDKGYHAQFYEPYKTYPGKIIAIPGNHDGELFKYDGSSVGQKVALGAFLENFCQPKTDVPPAAGTIYREMVSQPAVYWHLDTPYADIVALYSNVAENPGYISAPSIGNKQKDWLIKTLKAIKATRDGGQRKALLIATHHPPFSSGSHSSSTEMLIDIDNSCSEAGIMPDLFLSAHAHNIQCYTRYVTFDGKTMKIPFLVCGGGGRPVQHVPVATGARTDDKTVLSSYHTFDESLAGFGYQLVSITQNKINVEIYTLSETQPKSLFNKIEVDF